MSNIDYTLSKGIYDLINSNKIFQELPFYFGLLPYELYVIPGMYLALFQVIWLESLAPIQFHLLPHWFAYSFFNFLKKYARRGRPGCVHKNMSKYIDESHCEGKHKFQSFPSGHTGVAFSLATALAMEMWIPAQSNFFDIKIDTVSTRLTITIAGFFVATMVSLQRVAKGYHHLGDVIVGACLGSIIGYISWHTIDLAKYYFKASGGPSCELEEVQETTNVADKFKEAWEGNKFVFFGKVLLTIALFYLTFKFFGPSGELYRLTSIKH